MVRDEEQSEASETQVDWSTSGDGSAGVATSLKANLDGRPWRACSRKQLTSNSRGEKLEREKIRRRRKKKERSDATKTFVPFWVPGEHGREF